MPILIEPRHERFAQAIASGKTIVLASRLAGWTNPQHELARRPDIKARVAELLEEAASAAVMESREWQERMTRRARLDVRDLIDLETGKLLNPGDWPDDASEAVDGIEQDFRTGAIKLKLGKAGALTELGQMLGMKKIEVSGPNGGPIQSEVTLDLNKLSVEALMELAGLSDAADAE